jgi:hypothetical protein
VEAVPGLEPTAHAREILRRQAGSIWLCSTDFYAMIDLLFPPALTVANYLLSVV